MEYIIRPAQAAVSLLARWFPVTDDPRFQETPPWGWTLSLLTGIAVVVAMFAPLMFAKDIIEILTQWS